MTTINTRSNKAALEIATARGLAEGSFTITKIATAKYELAFEEKTAAEVLEGIANPTVFDVLGAALLAHAQLKAVVAKPAKAQKADRHWNDDGSLTVYIDGKKARRFGGDENEEASEEEIEDPEAAAEKYLSRKFTKKTGGWIWGRTTQGHNWKNKKAAPAA